MDKVVTVMFRGPRNAATEVVVTLTGVPPSEPLRPKLAVFAARAACGHRDGVSVFDNGGYYYRLYLRSARKVYYRRPTLKSP